MSQASNPAKSIVADRTSIDGPPDRPLIVPMIVAAVCVGLAIHLLDGEYTPAGIGLITLALVSNILALIGHRWLKAIDTWAVPLLLCGLLFEFAALITAWPGVDLPHGGRFQLAPFYAGLVVALASIAAGTFGSSRVIQVSWFPILLASSLGLSIWMVRSSPDPRIDVFVFQQEASAELLKGRNPYAMTFPDIYHSSLPGRQEVYGHGLVVNDRAQFGFPYPPVSLLLATIGYVIAGDHRYAQAVALVLAGLLIGFSGSGQIPKLAAALLWFTPRVFFVLGRAWTEPFTVMLLAATIFCACRRSRLLPIALGLLLATKQYMILAVPLTFFLLPRGWRWRDWFAMLGKAGIVAVAVTMPLALWDFGAFWKSTVTVQQLAPFRWDALSYIVWYGFRGHLVTPPWVAAFWSGIAALSMLALSLWRSPRTPAGFAASLSLISLAFFSFNKQAFCNYYFFVIGAMCCTIAAASPQDVMPRRR